MQLELDLVTVDDHRQHRFSNHFLTDFAESLYETVERHHGFCHRSMAACTADIIVEFFHDLAGALDVSNVAHRNHDAVLDQAGNHAPVDALDLQAKLRQLW